jgi:hypothetical protein
MRLHLILVGLSLVTLRPLAASDDWLALPIPRPLAQPWLLSIGLQQAQRELWAGDDGQAYILRDADGQKLQRRLSAELGLRWQATPSLSLGLSAPLHTSEWALWSGVAGAYPRLDDPGYLRNQGLGDLRIGLRQDWAAPQGLGFGWGLQLSGPSGLGPFEAPHPAIATGEGRWQGDLRGTLGGTWGAWSCWLMAGLTHQAGRESVVSDLTPLSFQPDGPRFAPPGASGALHLDPRRGSRAALALGWDWFRGDDARHSVGLALQGRHQQALGLGGRAVDGTESLYLSLQPELQARFGAFNALVAWDSAPLFARHAYYPYYGELRFRLDHAF